MKKFLIGTVATAALIALAPLSAQANDHRHHGGSSVEMEDNNIAQRGSVAMDDDNNISSYNNTNSNNDRNSYNQDNDQDNDKAKAFFGAAAADHSTASMDSFNTHDVGNVSMVNHTKLKAVNSGNWVGHIVHSGDGGDGGDAKQKAYGKTYTKGGSTDSEATSESEAKAKSGADAWAKAVPSNTQEAEVGDDDGRRGGRPLSRSGRGHGGDGGEAENNATAGGTATADASADGDATSGDSAAAADGTAGGAWNTSCVGCDATISAGGGGGSGQAVASLTTGAISGVNISNTAGIMSVPMNTGLNANQLQSVSINAQASFNN